MPFDPTLPANNSLISSAELRAQFNGLQDNIAGVAITLGEVADTRPTSGDVAGLLNSYVEANTPASVNAITIADFDISDPPTTVEVTAVKDKLNELITALRRP